MKPTTMTTPFAFAATLAILLAGCSGMPLGSGAQSSNNSGALAGPAGRARPFQAATINALELEVAHLLSADAQTSQRAMAHLRGLNEEERLRFLEYARTRPELRDPRWLSLLADHHAGESTDPQAKSAQGVIPSDVIPSSIVNQHAAMPSMSTHDTIKYLAWRATQPDRVRGMRAQSRLIELATTHPNEVRGVMQQRGAGVSALTVALASANDTQAGFEFVDRYRTPHYPGDRPLMAEALAVLTRDEVLVRHSGSPWEIEEDAARADQWIAQQNAPFEQQVFPEGATVFPESTTKPPRFQAPPMSPEQPLDVPAPTTSPTSPANERILPGEYPDPLPGLTPGTEESPNVR